MKCAPGGKYDCLECCAGTEKVTKSGYTFCAPSGGGNKPGKKGSGEWYSLVDNVRAPSVKGEYLLSFRW